VAVKIFKRRLMDVYHGKLLSAPNNPWNILSIPETRMREVSWKSLKDANTL
jgi:hypothetical protein